jgi:cytochrome P450
LLGKGAEKCLPENKVYLLASGIYNAFFSPLRKVKGPILNSVSWLPWYRYWFSGHMHLHVLELHEKYGPAVRIGPSEVSFIDAKAWKDIYSIKRSKQIERDPNSFPSLTPHGSKYDLLTTKPSDHDRYRQILNTYFSERFVKSYEPIIQENAKIMILQLSAGCQGKESNSNHSGENITKWFQWLAFDIIGDVTWGRSFGCVTDRVSHPCLALSMDLVSMSSFIVFVSWWTALKNWLVRLSGVEAMFINLVRSKCTASTQIKQEKATLYSNIVKDGNPLTQLELDGNLTAIVIAGSETTGFALTATSYYLAKNPGCFQKAAAEVRSSFQTADEINDEALKKLPYLQAIIKEALRLTPAEPNGLARKVVVEHMEINEQYIPKDVSDAV